VEPPYTTDYYKKKLVEPEPSPTLKRKARRELLPNFGNMSPMIMTTRAIRLAKVTRGQHR